MFILWGVTIIFYIKLLRVISTNRAVGFILPLYLVMINDIQNLRCHLILPSCRAGAAIFTFPLLIFTSWNWGLQHFGC